MTRNGLIRLGVLGGLLAVFSVWGYFSMMVTDTAPFRYPYYHTQDDTPEKVDYDRLARVVAGLARVVAGLAGE